MTEQETESLADFIDSLNEEDLKLLGSLGLSKEKLKKGPGEYFQHDPKYPHRNLIEETEEDMVAELRSILGILRL